MCSIEEDEESRGRWIDERDLKWSLSKIATVRSGKHIRLSKGSCQVYCKTVEQLSWCAYYTNARTSVRETPSLTAPSERSALNFGQTYDEVQIQYLERVIRTPSYK